MRRRKLNYKKLIGFFFLLILGIGSSVIWYNLKQETPNKNTKEPNEKEEIKEEETPKDPSLTMVMVGDALIHANVFNDAREGDTFNFDPMFADVKEYITGYDLAFYNQESPFGGEKIGYSGYPLFNTPSEIGDTMLDMGFNLVSLANNHTLDKGATAAINSLEYWNSKEDVIASGSYLSEEDRKTPVIKEKNGIKYTMLAYATLTNLAIPKDKPYLLNMYDKQKAKADIERVRDKVDLLVVSMHWGTEYATKPNAQQKEIATYLASLGVDIIIGTHTHSVQPIDYIDGTLVIYSLGNFISSQLYEDNLVGLVTSLKVTKSETDGKVSINFSDLKARLIYTYYKQRTKGSAIHIDHRVIPFDTITTDDFADYKEYYDKYKQILQNMDDTIEVAAANE